MVALYAVIGDVWINPSLSLPDLQLWTGKRVNIRFLSL